MNRLLPGTSVRVLLVTLLAAVLGLTGLGAVPTASAAPPGAIEGTVTDADGAGLGGIEVTAYEFDGVDSWTHVDSTTTKNNGSYTLKPLPAATYQVEFFDNQGTYVSEFYDDQPSIDLADGVPVAEGQTVAGIDAELARTGTIRGTVTDEQGQPVPGIFIDILTVDEDGFPTGSPNGGITNDAGVYVVPFIDPGQYAVGFVDLDGDYVSEYYDDHLSVFDSDLVSVTPAGVTAGIDAELAPGGHISGTVTDSGGQGIADVEIDLAQLVDGEWSSFGEEFGFGTQDDGTYEVGGLPAGTWRVGFVDSEGNYLSEHYDDAPTFEDATDLALPAGGTLSGIDASLDDAAHIEGTVTDEAGTPLERVSVAVWQLADDGHWEIARDTETDANGDYSVRGLRGGTYRVGFQTEGEYAAEYYDDVQTIDAADDVVVDPGETVAGVDAELALAARIKGTVTGPDGLPGDKIGVAAWLWTGTEWELYESDFVEQTEVTEPDNGHYEVDGLIPGTYRLEFQAIVTGEHEFWDDQPSLELAQDIVVTDKGQVLDGYDAVLEAGQYPFELENVTLPTISGSPAVGQTLTASSGTWNLKGTTYHYQWLAAGAAVGTDSPTYQPTAADVGKTITVTVVASVAGIGSAAATSAQTAPVTGASVPPPPPPPGAKQVANLKLPVVKGILEVGRRARVTTGRWSPAEVDLTYRWFVGGKRVAKSDQRRLLLKEKWVGKRLKVVVVAKADGYLAMRVVTERSSRIKP